MSLDVISHLLITYRYWIVIPLAFLEGPIVALNVGFLSSLGYFNPFTMFGVLMLRDVSVDGISYAIGHFGNRKQLLQRYSTKIGIGEKQWNTLRELWMHHPAQAMFVSKLAYGISAAFLISAGIVGIGYKRFWSYAIVVSFMQYSLLLLLGYYFGSSSYALLAASLQDIEFIFLGILVLSVTFYFFSRSIRKRLVPR